MPSENLIKQKFFVEEKEKEHFFLSFFATKRRMHHEPCFVKKTVFFLFAEERVGKMFFNQKTNFFKNFVWKNTGYRIYH